MAKNLIGEKNVNLYMQEVKCMPKRVKSKKFKSRLMIVKSSN